MIEENFEKKKTDNDLRKELIILDARREKILNILNSRLSNIKNIFRHDITENNKFLHSILLSVKHAKKINDSVDTYKTSIPFYGVEMELTDGKKYTIMFQSDSDYMYTLQSYCEGYEPYINRYSTNVFNIKSDLLYAAHDCKNVDELENLFNTRKAELTEGYENIEVLTILYCIKQM